MITSFNAYSHGSRSTPLSLLLALLLVPLTASSSTSSSSSSTSSSSSSETILIMGYGNAAKAALEQIRRRSTASNVVVVDPNPRHEHFPTNVSYIRDTVKEISSKKRHVVLSNGQTIAFKKLLVSTGTPKINLTSRFVDLNSVVIEDVSRQDSRRNLLSLVASGHHVTLIGSSWEVVKFAITLAKAAKRNSYVGSVSLIMPSSGPLAAIFPRYVSEFMKAKCRALNIEVIPYMHIRYIGGKNTLPSWAVNSQASIAVYCTRTFDSLDTSVVTTDAIGMSFDSPVDSESMDHFLSSSDLELDSNGGLVVNQSLMATGSIFVAGKLASVW
jgi:Pyridine nucleotide-disulphide oxidoreductase